MNLYDKILETYPELLSNDFNPINGKIHLVDDGDGVIYIAKWDFDKPIPEGLKIGKPKA